MQLVRSAFRIPPPPTMLNHGNFIVSLSDSVAWPGRASGSARRRRASRGFCDEAPRRARSRGRRAHGRSRTRRPGRAAADLRARERAHRRRLYGAGRGEQGYLTGAAIDQFELIGGNTADLGARRERGSSACARRYGEDLIHTMGWPLRTSASFGEFGGSFIYPMGDDLVTVGVVAGLESADVEFSVHDVLQEFKTHRLIWKILGGAGQVLPGERRRSWKAATTGFRTATTQAWSGKAPGWSTCRA